MIEAKDSKLTSEEVSMLDETNFLTARLLRFQDYWSYKFRPDLAWEIVDTYTDQYELENLKGYLIFLFMMMEYDRRSGPIKRIGFFFSKEVRISYYEYKKEIARIIEHCEKFLTEAEGKEFKVAERYERIKKMEFEEIEIASKRAQTNSDTVNAIHGTVDMISTFGAFASR